MLEPLVEVASEVGLGRRVEAGAVVLVVDFLLKPALQFEELLV